MPKEDARGGPGQMPCRERPAYVGEGRAPGHPGKTIKENPLIPQRVIFSVAERKRFELLVPCEITSFQD